MKPSPTRGAFTIIELLVVIAIIAIMAGTFALALRDGDRGAALQAAQSSLSGLVSSARAHAAVNGTDASIFIWGNKDDLTTYLHRAVVLVKLNGNWVRKGEIIDLTKGIYFVPPDIGTLLPAKQEVPADWNNYETTDAITLANLTTTAPVTLQVSRWNPQTGTNGAYEPDPAFGTNGDGKLLAYRTITINPTGLLANSGTQNLVIATGEEQPHPNGNTGGGILFRNADSMRGLILSTYGIPNVINEKAGFKN